MDEQGYSVSLFIYHMFLSRLNPAAGN